jgi:hypothetical protein
MTRQEAVEMNNKCIQAAEESFPSLNVWGTLPREHFLLYLDRFGKETFTGKNRKEAQDDLCRA